MPRPYFKRYTHSLIGASTRKNSLTLITLLAAACSGLVLPTQTPVSSIPSDDEIAVTALVTSFGQRLKNVALLALDAAQIQEQYIDFVSPELLQQWMADPSRAPGRLTSSPWPDRIEIIKIEQQGEGDYLGTGFVIEITSQEVTSGSVAAQYPVSLTVEKVAGIWLITQYVQTGGY